MNYQAKIVELPQVIKPKENIKPTKSKFVNKIRSIPEPKDDFLENELQCVEEEEAKLQASLARLDIKSLKAKHQAHLLDLENQAKQLEESIQNMQEIPKRKESPAPSEISTHPNSNIPDNVSVFSAHPYPNFRQMPDARSVCTEVPDTKFLYNKKEERKYSKREEHSYAEKEDNNYAKKEVHKIGAVFNEIAARSGRYNEKNPPPEYALPKNTNKEMISFRNPIIGPEYTDDVVKINPNVDIKNWFQDMPKWE